MVIQETSNSEVGFLFVGGHPALDFLNTEVIQGGQRADLLRGYDDLADWLARAGLLDTHVAEEAARTWGGTREGGRAFASALALRAELRKGVGAVADGKLVPPETVEAVNAVLRERAGYVQVIAAGETFRQERRYGLAAGDLRAPLADAATDLLCNADLSLVKKCENPDCILFFLDTTKNHKRRWCSMGACGNWHKQAAHYQRKHRKDGAT